MEEEQVTGGDRALPADVERPSRHGQLLGKALAKLAYAGHMASVAPLDMCATCAFREGCYTNQMAATGLTAFNCAAGIDDSPFGCHHGMKDGEPTKLCAGWIAAKQAPFATLVAVTTDLSEQLAAHGDVADSVRAETDAWLAEIDPDGKLDNYQRGRMFLRAQGPTS